MNSSKLQNQLHHFFKRLLQFRIVLFVLLVAAIYGFIAWRVNGLREVQPSPNAVAAQTTPSVNPNIDPATIKKIQQLQNNSVNVQALFNQARQNPFNE